MTDEEETMPARPPALHPTTYREQVAVVTGGASGIGLALTHELLAQGARVVVADIDEGPLAEVEASTTALAVRCDVRHRPDHELLRDVALDTFGAIDLVCLNAGVAPTGDVAGTSESTWRWLFEVNVMGVAHGVSVFAPLLVEQGSGQFLVTASLAGLVASPGLGAYSASKHAVIGLCATLRDELAPHDVGLTVVCPGFVATNVFDSERNRPAELAGPSHLDPNVMEFVEAMVASTGLSPAEVARLALDGALANDHYVLPNADLDPVVADRDAALRLAMDR
jgi:NAD(P)-dependent dehydrogenase (short-subunit alcohol dehydrogenase family)